MKKSFWITITALAFFWGAASVRAQVYSASPSATLKPTNKLTPTPTIKITGEPICGKLCVYDSDCAGGNGFTCSQGVCRNVSCINDATCSCNEETATNSAKGGKGKGSPETGNPLWWGAIGFIMLGWLGLKMRQTARSI